MEIIVDTSVLIAVLVEEPSKPALVRATRGADLIAPASVYWEIGNAFSAMLKRGRISMSEVSAALEGFQQIPIRYVDVSLQSALEISASHSIYAYDAYLLSCASQYRLPLLTLDLPLMRLAKETGIRVLEVS